MQAKISSSKRFETYFGLVWIGEESDNTAPNTRQLVSSLSNPFNPLVCLSRAWLFPLLTVTRQAVLTAQSRCLIWTERERKNRRWLGTWRGTWSSYRGPHTAEVIPWNSYRGRARPSSEPSGRLVRTEQVFLYICKVSLEQATTFHSIP